MPDPLLSVPSIYDLCGTVVLAVVLVRLVLIDLREFRLPDRLTLPLIAVGVALAALRTGEWPVLAVAGAALGFAVFWLIGTVYFRLRGVDGLGLGDAKLLAAAGAWLGPVALPWLVLMSASGALIWALARHRGRSAHLAFGPWLAGGFWALWMLHMARQYF